MMHTDPQKDVVEAPPAPVSEAEGIGATASTATAAEALPSSTSRQTSATTTPVVTASNSVSGVSSIAKGILLKKGSGDGIDSSVSAAPPETIVFGRTVVEKKEEGNGGAAVMPPSASSSALASSSSSRCSSELQTDLKTQELIFDFGRYVGEVDPLSGLRSGHGVLHYRSGNVYTGEWRDGAAHGFGEKRYRNGDIYRGLWREGKRSGRGSYLFVDGHLYEGMYVNDCCDGNGIFTTLNGDRYAGQWKAGLKHGKGREELASGQVFVGNWRSGKKQGRGKLYIPGAEGYIYGIWNDDHFFRELTLPEKEAQSDYDIVDEFGLPRDPSAPPIANPWERSLPSGAGVADHVLRGLSAIEARVESLGKALDRVIGGGGSGAAQQQERQQSSNQFPYGGRVESNAAPVAGLMVPLDDDTAPAEDFDNPELITLGVAIPDGGHGLDTPPASVLANAESDTEAVERGPGS